MPINLIDSLNDSCSSLPSIPHLSLEEYSKKTSVMTEFVNNELASRKDIASLVGENQLEIMYNNHSNHAMFMYTVFKLNYYEMLAGIIPWVYRAYSSHNFSYNYFPVELAAWKKAIKKYAPANCTDEICAVYDWMIQNHNNFVALSSVAEDESQDIPIELVKDRNEFLSSLIEGDTRKSLQIASSLCNSNKDIERFYVHIIQSSMYEIGLLWEKGKISVAQEHLASSIIGRVISNIYIEKIKAKRTRGRAVVTSATNEFHEIGSWLISDLLEANGWNVKYLGANTPKRDLLDFADSFKPDIIAISITMPYNANYASDLISSLKSQKSTKNTKIMLGGHIVNRFGQLTKIAGADGTADNARSAIDLAEEWRNNE